MIGKIYILPIRKICDLNVKQRRSFGYAETVPNFRVYRKEKVFIL